MLSGHIRDAVVATGGRPFPLAAASFGDRARPPVAPYRVSDDNYAVQMIRLWVVGPIIIGMIPGFRDHPTIGRDYSKCIHELRLGIFHFG